MNTLAKDIQDYLNSHPEGATEYKLCELFGTPYIHPDTFTMFLVSLERLQIIVKKGNVFHGTTSLTSGLTKEREE